MTTGNVLYLVMVVAVFVLFSLALAYASSRQARPAANIVPANVRHPEPDHAIAA